MSEEYRVNLDIYSGPLDLLLYLIRRDEVDIYDIPISRITEQYVKYVDILKNLDPNLAGEFMVLAATLMEIKTRMLLPSPPPEEGGADGVEIDPRADLIRQLLEYKAFKDAAGDLREAAAEQSLKFPRRLPATRDDEKLLDLEDLQMWDLLDAFDRLMTSIGRQVGEHEVIYDDTPIELHAADIADRLQRDGPLEFSRIFEGRSSRSELVGLFLAMLELVRRRKILASQDENFGEIMIHWNPDPPPEDEADNKDKTTSSDGKGADTQDDAGAGTYVSDAPPPDERDDDDRRDGVETLGI